jgi:hypothetical protein
MNFLLKYEGSDSSELLQLSVICVFVCSRYLEYLGLNWIIMSPEGTKNKFGMQNLSVNIKEENWCLRIWGHGVLNFPEFQNNFSEVKFRK